MRIECDEIVIGCSLVDDWLSALHQSQREVKQNHGSLSIMNWKLLKDSATSHLVNSNPL